MNDKLKLFLWTEETCGKPVLEQYGSGVIFALAPDLEEAKSLIREKMKIEIAEGYYNQSCLEEIEEAIALPCMIVDKPYGYFMYGSA